LDAQDAAAGDMGVAFGGAEVGVAEKGLDVADVGSAFEEVGGEGVTEAVDRGFCASGGAADGFFVNVLGGADCQGSAWGLAGEKPGFYVIKIAVFGDETGGLFRKKRATVFAALSLPDINHLAGNVNVFPF